MASSPDVQIKISATIKQKAKQKRCREWRLTMEASRTFYDHGEWE